MCCIGVMCNDFWYVLFYLIYKRLFDLNIYYVVMGILIDDLFLCFFGDIRFYVVIIGVMVKFLW